LAASAAWVLSRLIYLRILRIFIYTVYTHLYKYTDMYICIYTYEIDV